MAEEQSQEQTSTEDIIDESAEYSPKSEFSKPKLVFEVTQRCMEKRAKEMRKGYYNTTFTKEEMPIKTWVEDSRKVYCASVTALRKLLTPEILEDKISKVEETEKETEDKSKDKKDKKTIIEEIDTKIKELFKRYAYYDLVKVGDKYKKSKEKYFMPEPDSSVGIINIMPDKTQVIKEIPCYWNKYIDAYWNEMVELSDELFENLMRVIHRKNYFKAQISFG